MTLYEIKMHLKRTKLAKWLIKRRLNNEDQVLIDNLHKNGVSAIKDVNEALKDTGIQYFAYAGFLLGAIRDKDFIKWDNDLDYGILNDDNFKWETLENALNKNGYKKTRQFIYDSEITEQSYNIEGVVVDFMLFINKGDYSKVRGFFRKEGFIYHSMYEFHGEEMTVRKVKKVIDYPFKGTYIKIPENYKEFLEDQYGYDWMTPIQNWTYKENKTHANRRLLEGVGFREDFKN